MLMKLAVLEDEALGTSNTDAFAQLVATTGTAPA